MNQLEEYKHEGLKISASPIAVREHAPRGRHAHHVFGFNHKDIEGQEGYSRVEVTDFNGLPEFVRHEETTNIELFYDLFFVANLTTFSGIKEINDPETLTQYIGFFCVLWFTWCEVSLFDVRFIADCVLERAAKAVHLGVMVGLAIVGPNFNPTPHVDPEYQTPQVFQTMGK